MILSHQTPVRIRLGLPDKREGFCLPFLYCPSHIDVNQGVLMSRIRSSGFLVVVLVVNWRNSFQQHMHCGWRYFLLTSRKSMICSRFRFVFDKSLLMFYHAVNEKFSKDSQAPHFFSVLSADAFSRHDSTVIKTEYFFRTAVFNTMSALFKESVLCIKIF